MGEGLGGEGFFELKVRRDERVNQVERAMIIAVPARRIKFRSNHIAFLRNI